MEVNRWKLTQQQGLKGFSVIFLNYFEKKKNLKEGGGVVLGVMAEKERRTMRWDVPNKSRVSQGNQSANSGEGPLSGYKKEAKDILSDKRNWIDAAHHGVNYLLESKALKDKVPRGPVTKALGAPLALAQIAGESAWILSDEGRREKNKEDFEEQANTSDVNRALSGSTNTAQNLVGMGQVMKEYHESKNSESASLRGASKAEAKSASNQVREFELTNEARKKFNAGDISIDEYKDAVNPRNLQRRRMEDERKRGAALRALPVGSLGIEKASRKRFRL